MLDALAGIPARLVHWAGNLSTPALGVIGLMVMAGVGAGGFYAYQTYDYVQHDNDFCMSCHLMQEPFERFAESAHQGLGCKACHQPTLIARSEMALTQIVENPAEISAHAEVPNERCAHCHIEGDPQKWRLIAASAGHKVHLESKDPSLQGLQCVQCHSTSVHEFAPIDRTCAQSGCHEDKKILLAGMSDLTIHCAGCHSFLAPVDLSETADSLRSDGLDAAILPDQEECFSCHAMRALVEMPNPDPHRGVCAACHNPHEQRTPAEAVHSCANAGCHTEAAGLSTMHVGLEPGVLEDCTYCHKAHDFKVEGARCLDCHQGLERDSVVVRPHLHVPPDTALSVLSELTPRGIGIGLGGDAGVGWWIHPASQVAPAQERPQFRHSQHRSVDCRNCHSTQDSHGSLSVVTLNDCRSCHHSPPVSRDCARCHEAADAPTRTFRETRSVRFSVGRGDNQRVMTFPHAKHADQACGTCHTEGPSLSAANSDCTQCHEDHHKPAADCASCHAAPPVSAHPAAEAHVTCSGSGCHQNPPFETAPRTRSSCLACHQPQTDHRPGRVCVDCHSLPSPRGAGREALP
jgi:nitrate/TMAO reductase-like tetraheme cytochrome c subunit